MALALWTIASGGYATPGLADQVAIPSPSCPAHLREHDTVGLAWHRGPAQDAEALAQWCRAVGPPIIVPSPVSPAAPGPAALDNLVVLTWNAHLGDGDLPALVESLRSGRLTKGHPVRHFVLLLQEVHRRGDEVPVFAPGDRSAHAIMPRNPGAPDAQEHALTLGLSMLYVPSMRNGAALYEDRGNAIVSTEPLGDLFALELPLERQRRVAVGASVLVRTVEGVRRLNVLDVHLEPLSSPSSLWLFRNPRRRQMGAILDFLRSDSSDRDRQSIGTVLGGDFNTIQGDADQNVQLQARTWSRGLFREDRRSTHAMGRLDYLFVRLAPGWSASTTRIDDTFGSDHHPVLGRFASVE